jgi:hypothetical protein
MAQSVAVSMLAESKMIQGDFPTNGEQKKGREKDYSNRTNPTDRLTTKLESDGLEIWLSSSHSDLPSGGCTSGESDLQRWERTETWAQSVVSSRVKERR